MQKTTEALDSIELDLLTIPATQAASESDALFLFGSFIDTLRNGIDTNAAIQGNSGHHADRAADLIHHFGMDLEQLSSKVELLRREAAKVGGVA